MPKIKGSRVCALSFRLSYHILQHTAWGIVAVCVRTISLDYMLEAPCRTCALSEEMLPAAVPSTTIFPAYALQMLKTAVRTCRHRERMDKTHVQK